MEYQLRTPKIPMNKDDELNLVERVFANRGIDPQDIEHYLNTTEEDLYSLQDIANLEKGVKLLIKHIADNDKIFIQVDSDCDGFTSSALIMNYLHNLFPSFVENNIIYRIHTGKQHGIIPSTVPNDVKLVIIPDAGSNQLIEDAELMMRGIDILIIDHHEAEKTSEYACVINNQTCEYPNKSLSGVGMVWKFCCLID